MKMKISHMASVAIVALSLSGCASMFGDNNHDVTVNSQPSGAKVYLNDVQLDRTPTTVTIENPMSSNTIMVKKAGYEPSVHQVATKFQPVGALNIFFWPGFVVDAITGDMKRLDHHEINAVLSPSATSASAAAPHVAVKKHKIAAKKY